MKASSHLQRQGFQTYLPRTLKRRRHARRIETLPAPLFPRYLFVAIDMATQRWRSIQSTIGVVRIVCNGNEPAAIGDDVIESLQKQQNENGFIRLESKPRFAVGDRLRLLEGVFSSCQGIYEGMADSERVAVLLDMLGRKVRVFADIESVAAA
jgi:transcriptional antiterminator RfaH